MSHHEQQKVLSNFYKNVILFSSNSDFFIQCVFNVQSQDYERRVRWLGGQTDKNLAFDICRYLSICHGQLWTNKTQNMHTLANDKTESLMCWHYVYSCEIKADIIYSMPFISVRYIRFDFNKYSKSKFNVQDYFSMFMWWILKYCLNWKYQVCLKCQIHW